MNAHGKYDTKVFIPAYQNTSAGAPGLDWGEFSQPLSGKILPG
jgi:hypothetical protein